MTVRSLPYQKRRRSESILNSFVRKSRSETAKRWFTRSEHAAIMQATEEQRATSFFRYWVVKEALLKAQGIGLQGLPDCEIFLETDEVDTEVPVRLGAQFTHTLRVRLLPCEKGWGAAVAAQRLDSVKQYGLELL